MQISPGVILKKQDYSESDEIITVLLREGGIRKFFVSGSKKSRKRYQGLIDNFAWLNFHYQTGGKGLSRVQIVEQMAGSRQARGDLQSFAFSGYLAELICEYMPEAVMDHNLYELWRHVQMELAKNGFSLMLGIQYLLIFFEQAGYALKEKHPGPMASDHELKSFLQFLINFSEEIMQKKSRAAVFFLQVV